MLQSPRVDSRCVGSCAIFPVLYICACVSTCEGVVLSGGYLLIFLLVHSQGFVVNSSERVKEQMAGMERGD